VIVRLVLWSLADSKTTLAELRRHLGDASEEMPGLRFRAWISDETTERFGAVELWESAEAAEQEVPGRVRELIGKDPEVGETFDVES
jgi:hypothetical protein